MILKLLILSMAVLMILQALSPVLSHAAGTVTDNLTIKVGYEGGPFYTKATYSWKELDDLYGGNLSTHQVAYSYFSGRSSDVRNVVVSARGFYISDLLEYAGIDLGSIAYFEFYTDDQKNGKPFTTMSKRELLDNSRYYYPNMGVDDDGIQIALDGGDMTSGATRVQSMLALEDNWEWDAIDSNFAAMSAYGRFHLLFGQENVTESRTNQAAKYVNTIAVVFSGAPVIGAESNIELKVGTDYRVQVNVTAADTQLENYILENLVWSSNNTDIVEVDQYGNLTVKGEGTATITATSGSTTGTVTISTGNGSGTGTGSGETGESAGESGADTSQEAEASDPQDTQVSYSENTQGVYILSRDFMNKTENAEWVNSILKHDVSVDSDEGSVMNWRDKPMDDDAVQLVLTETDPISMTIVFAGLSIVFLLGIAAGPAIFAFNRRPLKKGSGKIPKRA